MLRRRRGLDFKLSNKFRERRRKDMYIKYSIISYKFI